MISFGCEILDVEYIDIMRVSSGTFPGVESSRSISVFSQSICKGCLGKQGDPAVQGLEGSRFVSYPQELTPLARAFTICHIHSAALREEGPC
jgi:hypothetical protein